MSNNFVCDIPLLDTNKIFVTNTGRKQLSVSRNLRGMAPSVPRTNVF